MKICISSTGKDASSPIDFKFGRCPYFMVYDNANGEIQAVENKGISSPSGAGIAAAQTVIDLGADVVLTGNIGPNAMNLLKASDIKIIEASGSTVKQAIDNYMGSEAKEINKAVSPHFGMGNENRHRGGK